MKGKTELLDCTLRDGAYIVDSKFGVPAIKGIIRKMQEAKVDIIECGWLKDAPHEQGSTFYHLPSDMEQYLTGGKGDSVFVAMIDWDRYDLNNLPPCDGRSIDAIRVVFPHGKFKEGIALGKIISEKGYRVYFQAANTLAYTAEELASLAAEVNNSAAEGLSIVDTFGAMFEEDLQRIGEVLDAHLNKNIKLGFHSHNNRQLSFALSMSFVKMFRDSERKIIVDSSLCGMGRGAGNTTTELMADYLNRSCGGNYDMNEIMDAIDMYMAHFLENYKWGYSTPYLISGMYCAHVNNIAYLLKNHRTNAKDMRNIIGSLSAADRVKYDYDLLEQKYMDYQDKAVDDSGALERLREELCGRRVLLISPGKNALRQMERVEEFIKRENPVVIGVNAVLPGYRYDYLLFVNKIRYGYASEIYSDVFNAVPKIVTSNIKTEPGEGETIVNFNTIVKRGWEHFDNAVITGLRLMNKLRVKNAALAGFDGFSEDYAESYSDVSLVSLNPENRWNELNEEIRDMFGDIKLSTHGEMEIEFITDSKFSESC